MQPDKKIKLFADAHCLEAGFQGTGTFMKELYTILLEKHYGLEIYFGTHDPEKIRGIFPTVAASHILQYKKNIHPFSRLLFDIPRFISEHRFQFAHFQNISLQKRSVAKYIVTLHDTLFCDYPSDFPFIYRNSRSVLFGKSIGRADIKTTVSAYSQNRIAAQYKIPLSKIYVVPNGVKLMCSNTWSENEKAAEYIKEKFGISNFILNVSRIEPRKNHLLLLEKYLKLSLYKKNISLVFIGKESIKVPGLSAKIRSLNAEQKAMFHWFEEVTEEDLAAFYSACKLFVYPSKAEGFGIPPLEAAVYKAPVLCSSSSAMKDYVFFQPYTFDPENKIEFEEKLEQMLESLPALSFRDNIARNVTQKYSWQNSADIFYELIKSNA